MRLLITTPTAVVIDDPNVVAVRAEDESGSFGILNGHADFLTALTVSVVLGAFFMPFLALTLLWLLNTDRVPREWRNKLPSNVAMVLCAAAFCR